MASLAVTIKTPSKQAKKILVEIDALRFERLAANFGFFSSAFLKSVRRAEKDYQAGRVKKIKSLKELA